jgi:hypothetical protein
VRRGLESAPNPFRRTNTISYTVTPASADVASFVCLAVYDVRGRRVATLVDGRQAPGMYTQRWSGLDHRGMRLPAGVYWFNLRVDGRESRHRTILLR